MAKLSNLSNRLEIDRSVRGTAGPLTFVSIDCELNSKDPQSARFGSENQCFSAVFQDLPRKQKMHIEEGNSLNVRF